MAMRMNGWMLAATSAAALGLMAITLTPAQAAFCVAGETSCTTGDSVTGGTFLGLVSGGTTLGPSNPSPDDIAELKVAAQEVSDPSLINFITKIDENGPDPVSTAFSVDDIGKKSGTFTYNGGFGEIALLNVVVKGGSSASSVFALSNISVGDTVDWSSEQDLSNMQFAQVVPLPAAAWMMIGGLALVAGAARKLRRPDAAAA